MQLAVVPACWEKEEGMEPLKDKPYRAWSWHFPLETFISQKFCSCFLVVLLSCLLFLFVCLGQLEQLSPG